MTTKPKPKLAYIIWKDAVQQEAAGASTPVAPQLATLHEVGFLLEETPDIVTIGMEQEHSGELEPGRWRLHIPRAAIVEMRVFAPPRARKVAKQGSPA